MAFTYDGDPAASDLANLRFTVGDTDSVDPQFFDAELNHLLTEAGSVKGAAVTAVRRLIAKYSRFVNKSVGDLRNAYSDRLKNYQILLKELQNTLGLATAGVIAGGISKARKKTVAEDSDRVVPSFQRGQFEHPGTPNPSEIKDSLLS